jgi:hypothetical protein
VIKLFTKLIYTSKKFLRSFLKPGVNALRKQKTSIARSVNARIINPLKLNTKNIGGPKDALETFEEINKYVKIKKSLNQPYFSWEFFNKKIAIKDPVYTIGMPLPGAEVFSYHTVTTEHVYLMPNIRIYSKYFFTLTEDNYLLSPVSNYYGNGRKSHPAFGIVFLSKCKKLKGRSVIVRGGAYWHKMQDGIPALYLAELAGFDFDKIDHFIIQDAVISKDSIFTRIGIPLKKQVRLYDEKECYECEELLFSSWYNRKGNWYKDYLLKMIKPNTVFNRHFPEKIYISRSRVKTRRVLNEDKVINLLQQYGFECVHNEDLSIDEQIYLFQHATHIVSCHGSQLTNIIFSKPGTKVCEIRHVTHSIHYRKAFHDLSNGFGLDYYLLYTDQGEQYIDEENNVIITDTHMYIDLEDMKLMLNKMDLKEIA